MRPSSIPLDTDPEVFERVVDRWRSMTVAERCALVDQICLDVTTLAVAGIRSQRPGMTDVEVRHELARRRYGASLADAAYSNLDG